MANFNFERGDYQELTQAKIIELPPSNPNGYDVGEYIRAVFDNFEYSCASNSEECKKSELLRAHFPGWSSVDGFSVSPLKTCGIADKSMDCQCCFYL